MAASKSEVAQIAAIERRLASLEDAIRELTAAIAPQQQKAQTNGKIAPHVGR